MFDKGIILATRSAIILVEFKFFASIFKGSRGRARSRLRDGLQYAWNQLSFSNLGLHCIVFDLNESHHVSERRNSGRKFCVNSERACVSNDIIEFNNSRSAHCVWCHNANNVLA